MVFKKIKEALSQNNDEKYEVLYYKYSKIKLENQNMQHKFLEDMRLQKEKIQQEVAESLVGLYDDIEDSKNESFKIKNVDKDTQRLLISVNKSEKTMKDILKKFSIEEVSATDKFYDPDLHEVASYADSKGMAKGMILKTVKKGFKFKGKYIRKPKVVVTK